MSTNSINSSTYLQSILASVLQGTGSTHKTTSSSVSNSSASSLSFQPDNGQLSPLAQLVNALQQLQKKDPEKYQQVTQQIATNLKKAAQSAESQGNTSSASQLNQLASDFTSASKTGELPNLQDLAEALGGNSGGRSSTSGQTVESLLSALKTGGSQNSSIDPLAIIIGTLADSASAA